MICTPIEGYVAWNYLDLGRLGVDKTMEGFDLVVKGECAVSFGYNQDDTDQATDPYLVDGDTVVKTGFVPMEVTAPSFQLRLTFPYPQDGEPWEWFAANIYKVGEYEGPT